MEKVFFITTFHVTDHQLWNIVFRNWDLLGRSATTQFLFEQKLMGIQKAENVKGPSDLGRNHFPRGDQEALPASMREVLDTSSIPAPQNLQPAPKQRSSVSQPKLPLLSLGHLLIASSAGCSSSNTRHGTDPNKFGFHFCISRFCRYCHKLNVKGQISCFYTRVEFNCMRNISCRSSNLIYAITCNGCGRQYVGQSSLRLKDRFVHHYYVVDKIN